jgi:RimJ/RimL family protein N-acetyltransferase
MVTFEQTRNERLIGAFITAKTQFPELAQAVPQLVKHTCMVASDETGLVGLFILIKRNDALAEVHMVVLPEAWGERGLAAGCAFRNWVWKNTKYQRVVANIAVENALARKFTEAVGLRWFALNPRAMIRRGKLADVAMYGITRGDGQ